MPLVRAHMTAIKKLFEEQVFSHWLTTKQRNLNQNPDLDIEKQSSFRNAMSLNKKTQMVNHNMDRGQGSIVDGYCSQNEIDNMCAIAFEEDTLKSFRTRVKPI